MAKRSVEVTAVGYSLSIIYGLILAVSMIALITSFVNENAVLNSSFFVGKFQNIAEFQRHTLTLWFLFLPQFIGLIAVLRLKEWGRKVVVLASAVISFYFLFRMIFELGGVEAGSALAVVTYGCVVLFFNLPSIKSQFTGGVSGKKKILIIDDDKGLLKMMKVSLTTHGFDVVTAETGEKGIDIAKKEAPSLIILDVILPGIKGREVCSRLKNDTATSRIPVIFLTAKNSPDDIRAELELGAISHLTKPLESHQLLLEVNKILGA